MNPIGDRKDVVCLRLYSQASSRRAAISAMLDQKGRSFVMIQVHYTEQYSEHYSEHFSDQYS